MNRREFVRLAGLAGTVVVAGCSTDGGNQGGTPTDSASPTASPTDSPPATGTPTDVSTATGTPTATDTQTPSSTATQTPSSTATQTPSSTATQTPSPTATPSPSPTATPTPDVVVEATGADTFDPIRASISPGDTVAWTNTTSGAYSTHTVTSAQFHEKAKQWSMDVQFEGGETVVHTFPEAGIYEYYCAIHGKFQMCGAVLVGDVTLEKDLPCE